MRSRKKEGILRCSSLDYYLQWCYCVSSVFFDLTLCFLFLSPCNPVFSLGYLASSDPPSPPPFDREE